MKNIAKYAVVACVAFFALNSQSEAASLHIDLKPHNPKPHCVHDSCRAVKKHPKKECCCHHKMKPAKPYHKVVAARPNRKECRPHGR